MASDVSLNVSVDEENNDVASEYESEESDHESQDEDSLNEDQVGSGLNIVETDNDDNNDDFEDEIDTPPTSPNTQQQDRTARSQRRNADNNDLSSNTSTVRSKKRMVNRLKSDLGGYWDINCHTIIHNNGTLFAMMVAEQAGVKMMQEYFELEASKSTPMYGFRRGLKIFGNPGYQSTVKELKDNLIGRGCIDVLTEKETTWDMRKEALKYLMFLKRKRCGKLKSSWMR